MSYCQRPKVGSAYGSSSGLVNPFGSVSGLATHLLEAHTDRRVYDCKGQNLNQVQSTSDFLGPALRNSTSPGEACAGPHDKHQLYKTEFCKNFAFLGCCRYGDKCQFAHGPKELRITTKHAKYKTQLCSSYTTSGTCAYGTRCCFLHVDSPRQNIVPSAHSSSSAAGENQYWKGSSANPKLDPGKATAWRDPRHDIETCEGVYAIAKVVPCRSNMQQVEVDQGSDAPYSARNGNSISIAIPAKAICVAHDLSFKPASVISRKHYTAGRSNAQYAEAFPQSKTNDAAQGERKWVSSFDI